MSMFCRMVIMCVQLFLLQTVSANVVSVTRDTVPGRSRVTYYLSNKGSNTNDGTSVNAPKKNIESINGVIAASRQQGIEANVVLEGNSVFREEMNPVSDIFVGDYRSSSEDNLPKISGMDIIRDWTPVAGSKTYEKNLQHQIDLNTPQYAYILVAEIDTILERENPLVAVKYLRLAPSAEACQSTPGTYFITDVTVNPIKVAIHPTEGIPGSSRYRYEATTRKFAINGYNVNRMRYRNLVLQSSGNGYGMLGGGDSTEVSNVIFQGGGTHSLVIKSGTIDSCLFLAGPKGLKERIALIFYEAEGKGNVNRISNTTFLDIFDPIYTHTNGSVSHQSLTIDKTFVFADSTDALHGFSSYETDSVSLVNSFSDNYPTGFYGASPKIVIKNVAFRNTNQAAIHILQPKEQASTVSVSNVLIKTNGNDGNQNGQNGWVVYGVRAAYPNTDIEFTNSIVHAYSTWHQNNQPAVTTFQVGGKISASYNIYICDVNDDNLVHISRANNSSGAGQSTNVKSDYNVFIILRGRGFHWYVDPFNDNESNVLSLADWQKLTGQDKHSILLDLRNKPLGLKSIFVDPAHGNWTLNDSDAANAIKKVGAGMSTPLKYYPQRPLLTKKGIFRTPGGYSSFTGSLSSLSDNLIEWKAFYEDDYACYVLENSGDGISYSLLDTIRVSGNVDSTVYRYNHSHGSQLNNYYRLKLVKKDNQTSYSDVVNLKTVIREGIYLVLFPNPVQHTITVSHPIRSGAKLEVYDLAGQLIKRLSVSDGALETKIPIPELRSGLFVMRWFTNTESASSLFMK